MVNSVALKDSIPEVVSSLDEKRIVEDIRYAGRTGEAIGVYSRGSGHCLNLVDGAEAKIRRYIN